MTFMDATLIVVALILAYILSIERLDSIRPVETFTKLDIPAVIKNEDILGKR